MTQGELETIPLQLEKAMSDLEERIMEDVVRKIEINGFSGAASDWQISRAVQLGKSEEDIKQWIKETLGITDKELDNIFSERVYSEYYGHEKAYVLSGMQQIPYERNTELKQMVAAIAAQTKGTFKNMTASMGFITVDRGGKKNLSTLTDFYRETLDNAMMDIHSGAFDYNTVLKRTVDMMTKSGVRQIDYETGYHSRIEVAARRSVMTGFRQIQGKINEQVARELKTDYYEVTYHVGARPTHQLWQGRVWSYGQLQSVCGLGTVTGLHGANCYHDYNAFIPGASVRTYTDEQLEKMMTDENTLKEYNGKEYTTYTALQQQRKMERAMRKSRQDINLLQKGNADEETVINVKAKYQGQMQTYIDFSNKMKLPQQMNRVYNDGLKGRFLPTKTEQKKIESNIVNAAGKRIIRVNRTSTRGIPNSITQKEGKKGGIDRNYYDADGRQTKQISNNNHGNPKQHPYGEHGEHAHDYIYGEDGKLKERPMRELTAQERKENNDIL